ncbi:MAG: NAD(P)/FAD-dependent oxidoreductase [Actinomycetota bacterium]|nr:NAD(P)/FAD-dependent oxidoreductase [Actinomycetota bacterium]
MTTRLETDYLIIGAGAMGMAFGDVLHTESDAGFLFVDRHARPGGHWNDSYPFVRLHQPSAFYGVNSSPLGDDTIDQIGWNAGLFELASGTEVVSYFEKVMQRQFLPSGRTQYFPMCNYLGDRRFESMVTGETFEVATSKVVDATYMNVKVPSVVGPSYDVADGVRCVALNELPKSAATPDGYVIVGAGKTAMDAVLWLLANNVDPDAITWITPRDSWILDRAKLQPGPDFWDVTLANAAAQIQASAEADSVDDLFDRLEAAGSLMRIDPAVRPTMYRCATCTRAELDQLRRVRRVVRMGRVRRIEPDRVVLDEGEIPTTTRTLHVDCAADGLERRPSVPVFDGDQLTLQTVRHCQQVFSAALIAHIEVAYTDEATKNRLATVVPHPTTDIDWLRTALGNAINNATWRGDDAITQWSVDARLDGFSRMRSGAAPTPSQRASMELIAEHSAQSVANLRRLIEEAELSLETFGYA